MNLRGLKVRSSPVALHEPPDDELVASATEGNAAAFEKLMRRYNQRVFRAARGGAVARDAWQRVPRSSVDGRAAGAGDGQCARGGTSWGDTNPWRG